MFLNFLAFFAMQASPGDVLVVDGLAVGRFAEAKWAGPRAFQTPVRLSMKQVGIGRPEPQGIDALLEKTQEGMIQVTDVTPSGVYFSGRIEYPHPVAEDLTERSAGFAAVTRYVRSKDVQAPRPYLVHVWNANLLGDGTSQQIIEAVSSPSALIGKSGEGDWQVVLLRWMENGRERVVALQSSFGAPIARCRVRAIAGFDGSGTMQVVTSSDWNEGKSVTVWSFKGRQPLPLVDLSFDRRPTGLLFESE